MKVYLGLLVQRDRSPSQPLSGRHGRRRAWPARQKAESSHLRWQTRCRGSKLRVGWGCDISKPTLSDTLLPAKPHHLSISDNTANFGTKRPHAWDCGRRFSFKLLQLLMILHFLKALAVPWLTLSSSWYHFQWCPYDHLNNTRKHMETVRSMAFTQHCI